MKRVKLFLCLLAFFGMSAQAKAAEDVLQYTNVRAAPLNGCGARGARENNERAWQELGLSEEEKAELRTMIEAQKPTFVQRLVPGMRFASVAFCKKGRAAFSQNKDGVVAAWASSKVVLAETYVLKYTTGRKLSRIIECGNWVTYKATAPSTSPPAPPVSAPVVTPPPVTQAPVTAAAFDHQVDAYAGAGQVWHDKSHYGYLGFDWYLKQWAFVDENGAVHRLGFGADYSRGSGEAGPPADFRWDMLTLRPIAYKYEGKDGKTLRLRLLVSRLRDGVTADGGLYRNDRKIYFWGPEVIFTDQGRKDQGHRWWSEYRFSASLLFGFNKSGSHSWDGVPITDTKELLKVNQMLRLGARQYVYDAETGHRFFIQAGFSAQYPNVARSLGLSIGLDGPDELWTIWTGPSFDLKQHSWSWVAEVSLQIGKAYLHQQGLAAMTGLSQAVECVEKDGNAYYPSTGVLVRGTCSKDASIDTGYRPQPQKTGVAYHPSG